jgi:chromosome segregation ATPase
MKKLWTGLGGGLKNATGLLKELATEATDEQSPEKTDDKETISLKKQIETLKSELENKSQQISFLQETIESCKKPVEIVEAPKSNDLINFKIVIGMEESATALEMMEEAKTKLSVEKQKMSSLQGNIKSLEEANQSLAKLVEEKETRVREVLSKLKGVEEISNASKEQIKLLQESLLSYKKQMQGNIEFLFQYIKENAAILGTPVANVRADTLGFEDIQEFLYTQKSFFDDCLKAIHSNLKSKFDIKTNSNLESIKTALSRIIEDSFKKQQEFKEIAINSENLFQLSKKENLELSKKLADINKSKDELNKALARKEEEIGRLNGSLMFLDEFKSDKEKFYAWYVKAEEAKQELEAELMSQQKRFEDEKMKFDKTYNYVSNLEEQIIQLNQKIKGLSQSSAEKDKVLSLQKDCLRRSRT